MEFINFLCIQLDQIKLTKIQNPKMQSFLQWNNNKMYEGHIRRLAQIKQKQNKFTRSFRNIRIRSQPAKNSQQSKKKQFLPLPLVCKKQRALLDNVVKQRSMNLRQKQTLLQNYLLSKRILQTHSVFDSKLLKKQFKFHKKVSQCMNRSVQINRRTFSQFRVKIEFTQLQKINQQRYLGAGKLYFTMKIHEIVLIKRKIQQNRESRFSLIYKPEKLKSYPVKCLTLTELLNKNFYFRTTKKQMQKKNGLKFELQQARGNSNHKLAQFHIKIDIQAFKQDKAIQIQKQSSDSINQSKIEQKSIEKILQNPQTQRQLNKSFKQNYLRTKIYQKLFNPLTKFLAGSINFTTCIKHYQHKSKSKSNQNKSIQI